MRLQLEQELRKMMIINNLFKLLILTLFIAYFLLSCLRVTMKTEPKDPFPNWVPIIKSSKDIFVFNLNLIEYENKLWLNFHL